MSAFIPSCDHINLLAQLAYAGPLQPVRPGCWTFGYTGPDGRVTVGRDERQRVGEALRAQAIRSVSHRYPALPIDELPGATRADYLRVFEPVPDPYRPTPVQALMAVDGYEYQACEDPGWPTSEAHAICDALRRALIHTLPGYAESNTWDYCR